MMNNFSKNIREQLIKRANKLKNRMVNSRIADPTKIKGCSEEEILVLEKACELSLPYSYKMFLRYFGHSLGGRVMNDVEINYNSVFSLIDDLKDFQSDDEEPKFPQNTFFFSARYKQQYLFFNLSDANEDPPIFNYTVGHDYFRQTSDSIFDFLEEEIELTEFAVSRMKNKK